MTTVFKPIITEEGIRQAISSNCDGVSFKITHISFGGTKFNPTGREVALKDERLKVGISSATKINKNSFKIRARAKTECPFFCQSIAFWSNNTIFAIFSSVDLPDSGLFAIHNNSESVISYTLALEALSADKFEVIVNKNEDALIEVINQHEGDPDAHGLKDYKDEIKAKLASMPTTDEANRTFIKKTDISHSTNNSSTTSVASAKALKTVNDELQDLKNRTVGRYDTLQNKTIIDDQGNWNEMVWIPKFRYEDLDISGVNLGTGVCSAFIVDGKEIDGFWIAKYHASRAPNGSQVLEGKEPYVNISYDEAKALCKKKGRNWHLMSNHEWAAIAWLSASLKTIPRGNTDYGKSHSNPEEKRMGFDGGNIICGHAPATWAHNHSPLGVFDLVGNVWDWVDQLLFKDLNILHTTTNNPDQDSGSWPDTGANLVNQSSHNWHTYEQGVDKVTQQLERLLLTPKGKEHCGGFGIYGNNSGTTVPLRGGYWYVGSYAGLSALYVSYSSSARSSSVGFRPAFFEL